MAVYIPNKFEVNPNIDTPILDSSYIYGAVVYANNKESLPKNENLVKNGNLGIIANDSEKTPQVLIFNKTKGLWTNLGVNIDSSNSNIEYNGKNEVYFLPEYIDPNDFKNGESILVVDDSQETYTQFSPLMLSMIKAINTLEQEIIRLKNTLNDMEGGPIEDTQSNELTHIAYDPNDPHPIIKSDWIKDAKSEDSSNIYSDPSYYDKDLNTVIYNSSILDTSRFPYPDNIDDNGIDPSGNPDIDRYAPYPLRHFGFKHAKNKKQMDQFKKYLIPYEPVICTSEKILYYYDPETWSMVPLSGKPKDSSSDIPDDSSISPEPEPSNNYYVDSNNILTIDSSLVTVDENGILILSATIDENGILNLGSSKIISEDIKISNNILEINSTKYNIDNNGILNINEDIDNDGILSLNSNKSSNNVKISNNILEITSDNINNNGILSLNTNIDNNGILSFNV